VNEPLPFDIAARFIERSRHYLCVEYPAKIAAALRTVPPDLLWWRPNETSNSAGNLVLHLKQEELKHHHHLNQQDQEPLN
jgi:hypothetical protein